MRYTLQEIDTFLIVLETGSITAAATRLNLSKSVVSKRISDFEQSIGTALFRRHAGRIEPTEAAQALAERLAPAYKGLIAATEIGVENAPDAVSGTLAISAPMSFSRMLFGPIVEGFARAHPDLSVVVTYDDGFRDLARDRFDVGLRVGAPRDGSLISRKLFEDQLIPCASPAYLDRAGRPGDLADLRRLEVIAYSHAPLSKDWQFSRNGRWVTPEVDSRLTTNNGDAMRDMALADLGAVMLPEFAVRQDLESGALERILPTFKTRSSPVQIVWPPIKPEPLRLRKFIEHVSRAFENR